MTFNELVNHFYEDNFLKKYLISFISKKAKLAKKPEIKSKWSHVVLDLLLDKKDFITSKNKI
jgi:hypothetical protein